jgi:hypothetical protein
MSETSSPLFDVAGFKRGFTQQDVPAWTAYFADNSEWLEYGYTHPPRRA